MGKSSQYLELMLRFVRQGGEIALKNINKSDPGIKSDKTIVTKTDKAISKLAHKMLGPVLRDPAHMLIDEEDPSVIEYLDQERIEKADLIWSVDPIDGTRLYANGIPTFGISIGLMKGLKPWLGVVYFPCLDELFYCDGKNSYYVVKASTRNKKSRRIVPIDQSISSQTIFFCNDTYFRKYSFNDPQFHVMIQACAVVNLLWPAIGRGCGCFLRSSLWDFAGSWPMVRAAGLELRRVRDGRLMDRVDVELFKRDPKPWELKEHYLLSSERNYGLIRSKIVEVASGQTPKEFVLGRD